jgi:antitoxin PrlF
MAIAHSRVTSQGQISVPAEVRRKLGIEPGSVLEWDEEGGEIVVRRVGRFSSRDVHEALFSKRRVAPRSLDELKSSIRRHVKAKHGRG